MKKLSLLLLLLLGTLAVYGQEKVGGSSTNTVTVSKIVSDSLRDVTIVGASAVTQGRSTTLTLSGGGGSSVTVDNALDGSSTNPPSNAAVTAAISSATAGIGANTSGLASVSATLTSQGTRVTTLEGNVSTNTTNIAANSANITALTSASATNAAGIATNTSAIASMSALLGQLQAQVAGLTGTFTIQAPTLTVSSITNTGAVISWAASTSATSYTLESATNSGFTTGLTTLTITSGLTFTLSGLTAGTTYYLRIKASGGASTAASGYGTTNFTTTNSLPTLSTPTGLAATATSASAITVSWTASANATSYTVRYSTSPAMTSPVSTTAASTSVSITGLTAATAYYVDVSAGASGYNTSTTSATATATTQASFTIRETVRLAFQTSGNGTTISSGSSNSAIVQGATWNRMTPSSVTTANSYTLGNLVTETGSATSYSASLGTAFAAATASSYTATVGAIYPPEILARAYQASTTVTGSIIIRNLNPAEYLQLYVHPLTSVSSVTSQFTVIGAASSTLTKLATGNTGVSGGNEFDPNSALVYFKNVQPASDGTVTIQMRTSSGSFTNVDAAVFRVSVNPAP